MSSTQFGGRLYGWEHHFDAGAGGMLTGSAVGFLA
jgi:hypothetical protein